jgi:hypothetical protein
VLLRRSLQYVGEIPLWKQFRPWLALDSVQREIFNRRWEITDKIFKVAEWTIVVGILVGWQHPSLTEKKLNNQGARGCVASFPLRA